MGSFVEWWDALGGAMKLFYAIAFASTAVLVVQNALMLFGIDFEGLEGIDADPTGGADVSVVSVRTITAFLVGLGWTGAVLGDLGWSLALVAPAALGVGAALMYLVYWLMKLLYSLRESGNLNIARAVGETGTVYLPVPALREKAGKVEVLIQDRLTVVDAFSDSGERLGNREKVRVVGMVGDSAVLVEPLAATLAPGAGEATSTARQLEPTGKETNHETDTV